MMDEMLKGRIEVDEVVTQVIGGGLDPPDPLTLFTTLSAGVGPDGTAGGIWSKMAAVLKSGCITAMKIQMRGVRLNLYCV